MSPEHIADLYKAYGNIKKVAAILGHDFYTTKKLIEQGGGEPKGRNRKSKLTDKELIELYKTKTIKEISILNGTSTTVVNQKLHRLKVVMRKPGDHISDSWNTKHGLARRGLDLGYTPQRYIRLLAIGKLGGRCRKCGWSDIRTLQLNHINGVGRKMKRDGTRNCTAKLTKECLDILLGKEVPHLEVLCSNCNIIHEYERGNVKEISNIVLKDMERIRDGQFSDPKSILDWLHNSRQSST